MALLGAPLHSQPTHKLRIAAAADLQFALAEVVKDFRAAHPDVDVETVFGSSGNFYAEIANGAPFDLFLSADVEYPRRLIRDKLATEDSLFVYGKGHLAAWIPKSSALDLPRLQMRAVMAPEVKHIAIANPQHAPYGRAAVAALKSAGLYERVADKLVLGESVGQAFQFVRSGAAEIGIVALSLAVAPAARDEGRYWEVPDSLYPKIEQAGVILSRTESRDAARAFRSYMLTDSALRTLAAYGFH